MNKQKIIKALNLLQLESNMRTREWEVIKLLEEALQPEPKFYKNQPVLVSVDGKKWFKRKLKEN